jgi:hypothetical protein
MYFSIESLSENSYLPATLKPLPFIHPEYVPFIARQSFQAILSGAYTPLDVREFVELSRDIALPMIRKRMALGGLRSSDTGLSDVDLVYDCIAEIFHRDEQGRFLKIRSFFEKELSDLDRCSVQELVVTLRRLIAIKVNSNVIRIYAELDPAMGKILRNLRNAIDRSNLFEEVIRFGDIHLVPSGVDPCFDRPPWNTDDLRPAFARVVLIHETVPEMLKKMHQIVAEQSEYQRSVGLVAVARIFKEVFAIGWESDVQVESVEGKVDSVQLMEIVEEVCLNLNRELSPTYVETRKCEPEMFARYLLATRGILRGSLLDPHLDGATFYEYLAEQMPGLTMESYRSDHRPILEYIVKVGKERLRGALRNA